MTLTSTGGAVSPTRRYRAVLASGAFRRLFLSQLTSELGDFAGRIALAVLVVDQTGSALGAGAVLAVSAVPYVGLGQWLTGRCGRFHPTTVLVAADVIRAIAFASIALDIPLWSRFVLLFVASTASPVFEAVRNGLTPATVPKHQLMDAIGVQTITNEVTRIGGLALGGIVATTASPGVALVANALTFVVSALLLRSMPAVELTHELGSVRVQEGWRALVDDPICRRVLWLFPCLVAFGSIPEALVVPYVAEELPDRDVLVGVFAALVSLSIVATVPRLRQMPGHAQRLRQAANLGILGGALAAGLFALPSSIATGAVAYLAVGVVFAGRVNTGSAVSERLADRVRAPAFSVLDGVISVGQLVAGLGGGAAAQAFGVVPCFVGALALAAMASAAARVLPLHAPLHAAADRATAREPVGDGARAQRAAAQPPG